MSDTIRDFDTSVDLLSSLLWQHENAERIKALVQLKQQWYDVNQRDFWQAWVRDVVNIDTATSFGLSIWARILGVPLAVAVEDTRARPGFGFGSNHRNFNRGNFARSAGEQQLSIEQQRMVIRLRYFQLTSRGSVTEINEWLQALFGAQGRVFVVDSLDMTFATYFFSFAPDSELRYILENYDLLPRPAGVGVRYQLQIKPSFGFGRNHLNFERGNFGA